MVICLVTLWIVKIHLLVHVNASVVCPLENDDRSIGSEAITIKITSSMGFF